MSFRIDLRRAIDRFDLETYVEETFDHRKVVSNQEEFQVNCFSPNGCAGSDYHRHLYINVVKKRWVCFKCGYGDHREQPGTSNLVQFLADSEGEHKAVIINRLLNTVVPTPSEDLSGALAKAFEEQGQEPDKEQRIITFPREVYPLREIGSSSINYRKYILNRGFTLTDLAALDTRYVIKYVFPKEEGQKRSFEWKWRVVFPIYDLEGNCRSAVGRSITKKQENAWANWPNSDIRDVIWPLGHWDDGVWVPLERCPVVVLVEGVMDAHAVNTLTGFQALCTFGKKLSTPQMDLLSDLGVETVVLAWDRDAKSQIRHAVKRLSGRFEVFVFPFRAQGWRDFDFGDVLARTMDDHENAARILTAELNDPLSVESPEFCAWVIS
jgi:hypothetical protein